MPKQLKFFHRDIQVYLIYLMVCFVLLIVLGFSFFLNHWSQQLIRVQGEHVITIIGSPPLTKLTKKSKLKLKQLPFLELVVYYQNKDKKYKSWKKNNIKEKHLNQATTFLKSYREKKINLKKKSKKKSSPKKIASTKSEMTKSFFMFRKPLTKCGRYRIIHHNLLMQFNLTSIFHSTLFPFLGLVFGLGLVLLTLVVIHIEKIYLAMSKAISDIEGLLKEIFVGNFSVVFSAREFTFTQRIANIMNQMLFFYNEHAEQKDKESNRDPLTGLFTRRHFINVFETEIKRARRYNHALSFLLLDIDHFKKFNDNYGHLMGDKVLAQTSQLIVKQLRETDIVARYGGEEIAIILAETELDDALAVAEKLRTCIAESKYTYQHNTVYVTISIGVSTLSKKPSEFFTEIIKRADAGLYEAKNNGRNRVCSID